MGPHTLIKRPHNLDEIVGRPTGQGFGAARKGPAVKGPPQDVVVDEDCHRMRITLGIKILAKSVKFLLISFIPRNALLLCLLL